MQELPRFQDSKVEDNSVEWICGLPFHTVPNKRSDLDEVDYEITNQKSSESSVVMD